MDKCNSVVITGMGIISSIGHDIKSFKNSLKMGMSGIGYLEQDYGAILVKIGAEIKKPSIKPLGNLKYDKMSDIRTRASKYIRRSLLSIEYAIDASMQAWEMSGLQEFDIDLSRVGLVVAGSNINQKLQFDLYENFMEVPEYLLPSYAMQFMDTDHIGTISELFGIQGEGFTVGGASASGNVGIIKGLQSIQSGHNDICMVIGAMADLSPMELQAFYNIGAMGGKKFSADPKKACRPFDSESEGFIYGQASACVILESLESAKARGAKIYAEIMGGCIVMDGNKMPNPSKEGEARAMSNALKQAYVDINSVDYINTHGSSSPLGDATELRAIEDVFGMEKKNIWINSTKSLTGHCLWSSGIVEAIAVVLQLNSGFVHPNLNLDHPISNEFRFSKEESIVFSLQIALNNSFGFGGINTSIVIKRGEWN